MLDYIVAFTQFFRVTVRKVVDGSVDVLNRIHSSEDDDTLAAAEKQVEDLELAEATMEELRGCVPGDMWPTEHAESLAGMLEEFRTELEAYIAQRT